MEKKVKLTWDFMGPDAHKIAEHYEHHLLEFIQMHKLKNEITGIENISDVYATSYMVVDENEVDQVRAALRPKRLEWYETN
ncbi:MAG: hypothetical protein IT214_01880 [Chitinophagaceae bacterium]|jgi:hypothetical protein|nr:hypothetical protein [Chitinophagaceae bacterium]OQY94368.1 MAG: hypothetical protein B6D37_08950 [Sphingobacteriales bacterium UTBCD1]